MTISKELLDELLKGCERPEDLLGDAGLMKELKIKLMERMLGAELTAHLGYEEGKDAPPAQAKARLFGISKRGEAKACALEPLRKKQAEIHRGSRRRCIGPLTEPGYTSAIVISEPDPTRSLQ